MKNLDSITSFKDQSTWRLVVLGIVTYGVYFAHYVKKQTVKVNDVSNENNKISSGFVTAILVMSYISLLLFFAYIAVDEGHLIERLSNIVDRILGIMLIVWGFMARNRLNTAYEINKNNKEWFHGLWTLLFSPMYFNYKINSICEESVAPVSAENS